MKGMKKLLSIVLAGAMVIGSCSCSGKDSRKSGRNNDDDDDDWDDDWDI